jgi:4-amino-4-deoxy-L-arabinose transferase-like glycosyltransferase
MFRSSCNRCSHYILLLALAAGLSFPNLGGPSLWDIDEGNNAEAAREMLESGNWVVPTFNYELRVDKPALLYWLQIGAYELFGVNEFAARFPSAVAALVTVLMTYELARSMFGAATGLLAGVALATAPAFCASAHFANPDALLNAFSVLTLLIFWRSFDRGGRGWFVPAGLSVGLAVLAKGPVGLVLPGGLIALFLLWSRKLSLLLDRRLLWGALAFLLVALPWYGWVAADTKGAFVRGFFEKHNVNRYLHPLENHGGPFYYYLGILVLGFAPWSAFLGLAGWWGWGKQARLDAAASGSYRFLWCWIMVYFVFFALAATKLPNYILPVYVPVAILMARFLERWHGYFIEPPRWPLNLSIACLGLLGLGATIGLLVASGRIAVPGLRVRPLAGLEIWAILGLLFIAGAVAVWWHAWQRRPKGAVLTLATVAVLFVGTLAACGTLTLDAYKGPRALVELSNARHTDQEVRVGCYQYFQPSLVFYAQREVHRLDSEEKTLEFLRSPLPVYLFLPAMVWESLQSKAPVPYHLLARHYDLYRRCEVVVVSNH